MQGEKEYLKSLEEVFFEQYFEVGDEKETLMQNIETAQKLYKQSYKDVSEVADMLEDGLYFDFPSAILSIQLLGLSERFIKYFQENLRQKFSKKNV